jgi:hypothetical protein
MRCQRVLLASPCVVPTQQGGTCLGGWLLRRRGKFQLDRGGCVRMCGHQPGEQGAARTLPTGGRGTRQDLWAVRSATQGPLVTKATMGVQGSSSRARTGDRRDALVQARPYQEAAGDRGAQTLSKQMPSRSSQESRSPRLPAVRSKRLGAKAATSNLDPRRAVDSRAAGAIYPQTDHNDGDSALFSSFAELERAVCSLAP